MKPLGLVRWDILKAYQGQMGQEESQTWSFIEKTSLRKTLTLYSYRQYHPKTLWVKNFRENDDAYCVSLPGKETCGDAQVVYWAPVLPRFMKGAARKSVWSLGSRNAGLTHTHTNTKKNCSEESDIPLASACFDHSKMPPEVKYPVLKWSRGNCKGSARWLLRFRLLVEDLPQVQHWYSLTFPIYQFIHFIHIIQFSKWGRASFATSCWAPQSQARFGTRCSSGQLERERCTRYLHGTDGMSSIHTAFALGNGGMLINSSRQKWNKVKCQRWSCRLLVTFPKTLQVCWLLVSTTTERASLSYKIYVEWASWIFILWIETV